MPQFDYFLNCLCLNLCTKMSQELTKISFTLKQYSNMNLSSNILFKKNLKVNRLQFFEILNRKFHSSSKRDIFREKGLELMDLRQSDNEWKLSERQSENELTWLADENQKLAGKVASNRRFHTILREFHTSVSVNSRGKESKFKNRKGSAQAGGLKDLATSHELDLVAKPQNENTVVEIENINDKDYDFQHLEINEKLKKALLHDLKFNKMSLVQKLILKTNHQDEATIYQDDLLVRAKTGTGKTIAFLIYAIQNCLSLNRMESVFSSRNVPILILSPTRELANQIAAEADKLVKYLGLRVRVSVGGISRSNNIRDILQSCDILVATPGRLNDLLLNEPLIRDQFKSLKMVSLSFTIV
jgi:RecG-like helicase